MKRILLFFAFIALLLGAKAQEKWSLEQCIAYALENNIVIRQYQINSEYRDNLHGQSRNNRLPNLNAGVSQSLSFGRSLTIDNTYDNITTANTGVSASSNILIWQGGTLNNTIKQREYELKSSLEDLQKAKDDITLNIASAYLEILFAKELLKVAEGQTEQTRKQIERTRQLVNAGSLAEGTLLEIEAQLAREELMVVNRQNSLQMAYLNLAQLLELDNHSNFDILIPEMPEVRSQASLAGSSQVFERAVLNRPEIKSAEYQLRGVETQLKIAEGGKMPTLSAYAGISNNYFASERMPLNFNEQIKQNLSENIGVNLSIPIFSRYQNRTNIANAKLQISNQELQLEGTKKELRRQIEQAHLNAVAAHKRYNANTSAVRSMQESFRYIEEKYNVGRVTPVEYNDAKTNLAVAQSDLIQAKYEFIFRSKILDFYNGIPIQL